MQRPRCITIDSATCCTACHSRQSLKLTNDSLAISRPDCSDELQQLLRRCLQGQSQTLARVNGSVLPAGSVAVHGPFCGSGLQARVCPDPEPLGQHRAAALVGQQHRGAMYGQLRQMSLMASGVWPQPQRSHQGLIFLQLVRPQIHLQGASACHAGHSASRRAQCQSTA